jgi:hypothetical protein
MKKGNLVAGRPNDRVMFVGAGNMFVGTQADLNRIQDILIGIEVVFVGTQAG